MNALLAVALVAAGVALVVGARETSKRIALAALAAIFVLFAVRCVLCWLAGMQALTASPSSAINWFWPVAILALMAIGGVAWKTRAFRQRRLDDLRRRNLHPRRTAPPPQPLGQDPRGGRLW